MESAYVQFSDSTETAVLAVFGCEQSKLEYPNQQKISIDDVRYIKFMESPAVDAVTDPLEKLKAFLAENPDVAEILK